MDVTELLSASSVDLPQNESQERANFVGLHALTTNVHTNIKDENLEDMPGMLRGENSNRVTISTLNSQVVDSVVSKKETTLHSSFIPENAVLLETPRGIMLTVPENIEAVSYDDVTSSVGDSERSFLSCIPVSIFGSCEAGESQIVYEDSESVTELSAHDELKDLQNEETTDVEKEESVLSTSLPDASVVSSQLVTNIPEAEVQASTEPMKRKGGWPKGRKRKKPPLITAPRAPVTGYVLFAVERRKEIKASHPEISFPEATKILGQEWSSMAIDVKKKYLAAAEADKKRYIQELHNLRVSTLSDPKRNQNTRNADLNSEESSHFNDTQDNPTELHCKVCNVYFSNHHNKREHVFGKTHLLAVTDAASKELVKQQHQEESLMVDCSLVVSEDTCNSQDELSNSKTCESRLEPSQSTGPVDIHGFMTEFIHKNQEREQEISLLKRFIHKSVQDNMKMCKELQVLQEYRNKIEEEMKCLSSTTQDFLNQNDALKMVPALFCIVNNNLSSSNIPVSCSLSGP